VTIGRTATITTAPTGAAVVGGGRNLAAAIGWTYTVGVSDVKWRLVYLLDKPLGAACVP
jgi:hypothetical protein